MIRLGSFVRFTASDGVDLLGHDGREGIVTDMHNGDCLVEGRFGKMFALTTELEEVTL